MGDSGGATHDQLLYEARFRIWWWKLRFANRIYRRSTHWRGYVPLSYLLFCWDTAVEGWHGVLDTENKNIELALKASPSEAADEELSYWTDDGDSE